MSPTAVPLLAPIAALLAALVAGSVSFIALLVSKENKVSEFRQAWIDALRLDLADYVAALGLLTYAESQWVSTAEFDDTHWHDYLKTMQPTFSNVLFFNDAHSPPSQQKRLEHRTEEIKSRPALQN